MKRVSIFFLIFYLLSLPCSIDAEDLVTSIDFSEAARLAVSSSDELKSELMRMHIMEGTWRWGLRAYFPRISFSASEDDRLSEIGPDSFIKSYTVNVDQLLWDGGRISAARKIERIDLDLYGQNLERMAAEIAEAAVSAYRDVLFYRMVLDIRERAFEYLEMQRRILFLELELGLVLPIDLAAADITIREAAIEKRNMEIDLTEAEQRFAQVLGLDTLPLLTERIDIHRSPLLPDPVKARIAAESVNPSLVNARSMVERRQIEARYASRSWMPSIRLVGNAGVSGQRYPLTKFNWSVGLIIDFSSPWLSGNLSSTYGREGHNDQTARLLGTAVPLPDPASSYSPRIAALNLRQEQLNFSIAFQLTGRMAEQVVEKCMLMEQRRVLAVQALELEAERHRLAELRLELGRITRLELMDYTLSFAEREIAAVRAVVSLLEAERELERFLDLAPGDLAYFSHN